jgi:hypothetical protein
MVESIYLNKYYDGGNMSIASDDPDVLCRLGKIVCYYLGPKYIKQSRQSGRRTYANLKMFCPSVRRIIHTRLTRRHCQRRAALRRATTLRL